MPAYNSVFNSDPNVPRLIGNFPLLPLRTKTRGPAYTLPIPSPPLPANESPDPDSESYDILDEVIALFRANTFFRNFEIQGPADRLLVYGIWFISDCLTKIRPQASLRDAQKDVMNLALDLNFAIPGDPGWPLNQMYEPPRDRQEAEQLKQYLSQVRQELAVRLLARPGSEEEAFGYWSPLVRRAHLHMEKSAAGFSVRNMCCGMAEPFGSSCQPGRAMSAKLHQKVIIGIWVAMLSIR